VLFGVLVFVPGIRRAREAGDPLSGVDPPPQAPPPDQAPPPPPNDTYQQQPQAPNVE